MRSLILVFLLTAAPTAAARAADDPDAVVLKRHGVEPTPEDIIEYLRPATGNRVAELIARLGHEDYHEREKATTRLINMPVVPLRALENAAGGGDAEIRFRAALVLQKVKSRDTTDVLRAAFNKMRGEEYAPAVPVILDMIPQLKSKELIQAAGVALLHTASERDAGRLRAAIRSGDVELRVAAVNALANVLGAKALPELKPLMQDGTDRVRLAAASAVIAAGDREALPVLGSLLSSRELVTRAGAVRLLREVTGQRFGFIAYDKSPARPRAARRWQEWIAANAATAELNPAGGGLPKTAGAVHVSVSERHVLTGHSNTLYCLAFDAEGERLASAGLDRVIRLWDVESGKLVRTLAGHEQTVRGLAFSPDGAVLASSSYDHTIRLWNPDTGEPIILPGDDPKDKKPDGVLTGHENAVRIIAFSPDGKLLASTGSDASVRLWDVKTGKTKAVLLGHSSTTRSVAFSPDGKTLASASSDKTIKLWDVESGKERGTFTGHLSSVRSLAFLPDGRTLVSGSLDKTVRLWDMDSGKERLALSPRDPHSGARLDYAHTSSVKCVDVSPDGRLIASAGNDSAVRIWDAETGELKTTLTAHSGMIWHVAFSPEGDYLASCGRDRLVRIWEIERSR